MEATKKKIIIIRSSDGKEFRVSNEAAMKFGTIRRMAEDGCTDNGGTIDLPVVDGRSFAAAAEWAERHATEKSEAKLKNWDNDFTARLDVDALYGLFMAADFLDAAELVDLLAEKTASLMRGKTYLEIRQIFNIKPDFEPGVEEAIIRKNPWAFE